jgi:hypothetical protein
MHDGFALHWRTSATGEAACSAPQSISNPAPQFGQLAIGPVGTWTVRAQRAHSNLKTSLPAGGNALAGQLVRDIVMLKAPKKIRPAMASTIGGPSFFIPVAVPENWVLAHVHTYRNAYFQ